MRPPLDLKGERFGRLVVLESSCPHMGVRAWVCRCACGAEVVATTAHLRRGGTRSCGCLYREAIAGRSRTHGRTGDPIYAIWRAMRQRCENRNDPVYPLYGGRGIAVCERWHTFEHFVADVGERPADPEGWAGRRAYWSIDRIDVNGNYEPGNVRWADPQTQRANKRRFE